MVTARDVQLIIFSAWQGPLNWSLILQTQKLSVTGHISCCIQFHKWRRQRLRCLNIHSDVACDTSTGRICTHVSDVMCRPGVPDSLYQDSIEKIPWCTLMLLKLRCKAKTDNIPVTQIMCSCHNECPGLQTKAQALWVKQLPRMTLHLEPLHPTHAIETWRSAACSQDTLRLVCKELVQPSDHQHGVTCCQARNVLKHKSIHSGVHRLSTWPFVLQGCKPKLGKFQYWNERTWDATGLRFSRN